MRRRANLTVLLVGVVFSTAELLAQIRVQLATIPRSGPEASSNVTGCQAQREKLVEELKKLWDQYQQYQSEANQNQAQYRTAVAACAAGDIAMKIATYLIGPAEGTAAEGEQSKEANEAFKVLAEIAQKMINGADPLTIAHSEELGLQDLATLQGAVEAIGELGSLFKSITPESIRGHLQECSTPLPDGTCQAALSHIRSLESMMELAPEVQTAVNNIRELDIRCQDEQRQAQGVRGKCPLSAAGPIGMQPIAPPGDWPDAP